MATTQATKQTSPVNVEHRKGLDIRPGDTVRVYTKVVEKGKTRLQPFEGMVLARKHGSEPGATFTVRKVTSGVGVERIFPLYSPNIEKIELVKRAKTRRSKLYYIREKATREIRRKMKAVTNEVPDFSEPEPAPEGAEDTSNKIQDTNEGQNEEMTQDAQAQHPQEDSREPVNEGSDEEQAQEEQSASGETQEKNTDESEEEKEK